MPTRAMTFAEVATVLGVTICGPDDACRLSAIDHDRGEYTAHDLIHWRDRRMTKAALYRFLRLVVFAKHPYLGAERHATWRVTYLVHQQVNAYAKMLRVRIPFVLTLEARARTKSSILSVHPRTPLRREAFQWSRRKS